MSKFDSAWNKRRNKISMVCSFYGMLVVHRHVVAIESKLIGVLARLGL